MSGGGPRAEDRDAPLLQMACAAFSDDAPRSGDAPRRIGVAVSGGGDSMAALHLMHRAASCRGWQVCTVTIDHRLRPESAQEAALVAGFCASLGVAHETVPWTGQDGRGNLQDQARRARYALIAEWAGRGGITHVVLGHTGDDQAETFLMRLAREAGADGLAAMRRNWRAAGVCWSRPFLTASRAALRQYLLRHGIEWADDPSNEDERFGRVRARRVLAALKPLGISARTLGAVAGHLRMTGDAIAETCAGVAEAHTHQVAGDVVIPRSALMDCHPEIRRRLVVGAIRWINGAGYAPRARSVQSLIDALSDSGTAVGMTRTLAGCRISAVAGQIRFAREARAVQGFEAPTTGLWDARWRLDGPHAPGLSVRALGAEGLKHCPDWRSTGLPRASLVASPAVWQGAALIAAPLAGLKGGWDARLAPDSGNFARFLLSH